MGFRVQRSKILKGGYRDDYIGDYYYGGILGVYLDPEPETLHYYNGYEGGIVGV